LLVGLLVDRDAAGIVILSRNRTHART